MPSELIAPHVEAAALIAGKPVVTRAVFDALLPELRGRAFTITGLEGANVMQRVRDLIAEVPQGTTWDDAKAGIIDDLSPYLGEGAERRAELLLRTHGFQAFQASNWRVAQEDEDTTHLQYLATEDDNVRDSHLALNGLVLPKNDPFWDAHFPPWEWGCRCRVRPMNPDLVDEARADDEQRAPEDRVVMAGPALERLRDGQLQRGGRSYDVTPPRDEQGGGFSWHPDDLRLPLAELEKRYDPEVWSAFVARAIKTDMGNGFSVWEWLHQTPVAQATIPRAIPSPHVPTAPPPTAAVPDAELPRKIADAFKAAKFAPEIVNAAATIPANLIAMLGRFSLKAGRRAIYNPGTKEVVLNRDPKHWAGRPQTMFHELGHHLHFATGAVTKTHVDPALNDAMRSDFASWKLRVAEHHGAEWIAIYKAGGGRASWEQWNPTASRLGLAKPDVAADLDGAKLVSRIADTLMGISGAKFGVGHSPSYMRRNGAMEVFAHAFSAVMDGDKLFAAEFPAVTVYMRNFLQP